MDKFFYSNELLKLKSKIIKLNLICNKELYFNKDVGYSCLDCQLDVTSILCQECFQNSEHVNHNIKFKNSVGGLCDCGDKDAFSPIYYCKMHEGEKEIKDDFTDEERNEIIYKWKNILFLEFYKIYKSNNDEINNNDINDFKKLLNSIIKLVKNNIIILKLFSIALFSSLEKIDNQNMHLLNLILLEVNKNIAKSDGLFIKLKDFNLLDIILNIDFFKFNLNSIVKEFLYSFFANIDYKNYLGESYIKNLFKIFELNWIYDTDDNKYGLNCQLLTSKDVGLYALESKYIENFFKGIIKYLNMNTMIKNNNFYSNFNLELMYLILKKHSLENILKDDIKINYILELFISSFHNKYDFNYDLIGVKYQNEIFNYQEFNYIYWLYQSFEEMLLEINKIDDLDKKNNFYKNWLNIFIKKQINYNNKTYEDWEYINIYYIKNSPYIIFETIFSLILSYYFINNNLLKEKKETIINNLSELFENYDTQTINDLLIFYLKSSIKFIKNYIYIKRYFLGGNNYFLISLLNFMNKFLYKNIIFLFQIIKLFIIDEKFSKLFFENYFEIKINKINDFNDILINQNFFSIINFKFRYLLKKYEIEINNQIIYSNDFYCFNKEVKYELYNKIYNEFNIEDKNNFDEFLNNFYKDFFKEYFNLINKIGNSNLLIDTKWFKFKLDLNYYDNFKEVIINYLKFTKRIKISKLEENLKIIFDLETNKTIFKNNQKNILNLIIKDNFKFNKENGLISYENNDYNIDQSLICTYNSFLLSNILELNIEDLKKYNIFYIDNKNNLDFLNKSEFINYNLDLINKYFLNEFKKNELDINIILKNNLNNYNLDLLFILNEQKDKYLDDIKLLEKYSKEKIFFDMLLYNKEDNKINKINLKNRNKFIFKKLDLIKQRVYKKFNIEIIKKEENKIEKIDNFNIEDTCIICKKQLSGIIYIPIEFINDNFNYLFKLKNYKSYLFENNYFIYSCNHYFHYECSKINKLDTIYNYKCLFCKKIYNLILLNDLNKDESNYKKIYYHNIELYNYFYKINFNFSSLYEEFISYYINSQNNIENLNDLLIYNIFIILTNIFEGKDINNFIYFLIEYSLDDKIDCLKDFTYFKNDFENINIEFLVIILDLFLFLKNNYYKLENNTDPKIIMKDFINNLINKKLKIHKEDELNNMLYNFNKNLKIKKLLILNKDFNIENIKYKEINEINLLDKILGKIKLEVKFEDYYKNLLVKKCDFCNSLNDKNSLIQCLICNIVFCEKSKSCSDELIFYKMNKDKYDCDLLRKKIKEEFIENNDNIHNKLIHNNYGFYLHKIKAKSYILINQKKIFNLKGLYTNDFNQEISDFQNKKDYNLNNEILKKSIQHYINKKI